MKERLIDHDLDLAEEVAAHIQEANGMRHGPLYPTAEQLRDTNRQTTAREAYIDSLVTEIRTCTRLLNERDLWSKAGEAPGVIEQRLAAATAALYRVSPLTLEALAMEHARNADRAIAGKRRERDAHLAAALAVVLIIVILAGVLIAGS